MTDYLFLFVCNSSSSPALFLFFTEFTVIRAICGENLSCGTTIVVQASHHFYNGPREQQKLSNRKQFPYFTQWIKLSATEDPNFTAVITAREVLYNLLTLRAKEYSHVGHSALGPWSAFGQQPRC